MTRRAFVVGWPARHSRSPLIHRYWLELHGIEGDYRAEEVPAADLGVFLAGMESAGYVGGNVTVPHKEQVFALAIRRTPAAHAAVGTVAPTSFRGRLRAGRPDPLAGCREPDTDDARPHA